MENATQPGMIGMTEINGPTSQSETIYSSGYFSFQSGTEYAFWARTSKEDPKKFGSGIQITLLDNGFTVKTATGEPDWPTTLFKLNDLFPRDNNLSSFKVEMITDCGGGPDQRMGGIGTVDIRPGKVDYKWLAPDNYAFQMHWDSAKLDVKSPASPQICEESDGI